MNLKNERGFAVSDAIIAVLVIVIFSTIIVTMTYNVYVQANFIKRNDTATNYIVELFEYAKTLDLNDITYANLSQYNFTPEGNITVTNSENAEVDKGYSIYINVTEREPVAITFIADDGFTNPVQIDKNGVLFPVKDKTEVDSNVIPIISGLPVEHMSGGMRIPSKYRPLIDQIYKISSLGKNYFAGISEICVLPKDTGNYELALIPSQSKVKVLTDRSLNEDALKYMMVVLDVVNKIGADVYEIDLRYGSVSCKIR